MSGFKKNVITCPYLCFLCLFLYSEYFFSSSAYEDPSRSCLRCFFRSLSRCLSFPLSLDLDRDLDLRLCLLFLRSRLRDRDLDRRRSRLRDRDRRFDLSLSRLRERLCFLLLDFDLDLDPDLERLRWRLGALAVSTGLFSVTLRPRVGYNSAS